MKINEKKQTNNNDNNFWSILLLLEIFLERFFLNKQVSQVTPLFTNVHLLQ